MLPLPSSKCPSRRLDIFADVANVVSLGDEPMRRGGVDATEEPEKVPGEYVVNRGTRLDKTRMYECQGSGSDRRGSPAPGRWTVSKALFFTASNATLATFSEM